jgi:hypothetical protein
MASSEEGSYGVCTYKLQVQLFGRLKFIEESEIRMVGLESFAMAANLFHCNWDVMTFLSIALMHVDLMAVI